MPITSENAILPSSCRLELDLHLGNPLVDQLAVRAIAHADRIPTRPDIGEEVVGSQPDAGVDIPVQAEGAGAHLHRSLLGGRSWRSKCARVVLDPQMLVAADGEQAAPLVAEEPVADRPVATLHDEVIEIGAPHAQGVTLLGGVGVLPFDDEWVPVEDEIAAAGDTVPVDQEAVLRRTTAVASQFPPGRLGRVEAVKRGTTDGCRRTVCIGRPFPIDDSEGAMIGVQADGEIPKGHRGGNGHSTGELLIAVIVNTTLTLIDPAAAVIDPHPIVDGHGKQFHSTLDGSAKLPVRDRKSTRLNSS